MENSSHFIRNITILISFIILISIIIAVEFFVLQNTPTSTSTPGNKTDSHIIKWTDTTENLLITTSEQPIFDSKQQDNLIRTKGTLNKIIKPSENYDVTLFSGETITVLITPETYLGKAQFGQDKDGSVAAINYLPILKDTLSTLKIGQTISLSYYQKSYISDNKEITLVEFVLF